MRPILLALLFAALSASAPPERSAYIFVFEDAAEDPGALAARLSARTGGRVTHVYRHALRGCVIEGLTARRAARAANLPGVAHVERDRPVTVADTQIAAPWGLDRIDQRDLPLNTLYGFDATGSGVTVYVLDTGVRVTHTEFGGRASHGWDFVDNDAVAQDGHGHGTHVAGIAAGATYGVAKSASIVAVRVLGDDGSGTLGGVIAGVDWVTANAVPPAVANMSLGSDASPTLDSAVENSIASGVTYCVAAGNGEVTGVIGIPIAGVPQDACLVSPARTPSALTVGATDINDAEAAFSNFGACVDLLAPGVNIPSAWNTGDSATATLSGTSMATPHVAGAAALYLETNPAAAPVVVEQAIESNATAGRIVAMKSGLTPNLLLYTSAFVSSNHAVDTPLTPTGPATGTSGTTYSYSTGGSTCNQGHGVLYAFDWDDGTPPAYGASVQSHAWTASGIYRVRALARCTAGQDALPSPEHEVTITTPGTAGPMSVTPDDDFSSSGPQEGPFVPTSTTYTLENLGAAPMDWTVTATEPWIGADPASGTLAAGASTTVTVSVNPGGAPDTPGLYSARLDFTNVTTGTGSTDRTATLTVRLASGSGSGGGGDGGGCGATGLELLVPLAAALLIRRRRFP